VSEGGGREAHDALADDGAAGLHLARRLVQERIVVMDPDDEMLSHFVEP
jgi:hypothetical protein